MIEEPTLLEKRRAAAAKARAAMAEKRKSMMTTKNQIAEEAPKVVPEMETHPNNPDQVFVLLKAGPGSAGLASGATYEAMWADAAQKMGLEKGELLKQGYMFDVVSPQEAERLLA